MANIGLLDKEVKSVKVPYVFGSPESISKTQGGLADLRADVSMPTNICIDEQETGYQALGCCEIHHMLQKPFEKSTPNRSDRNR